MTDSRERWKAGIERELEWWRSYLSTGGLDCPEEFRFRFDPEAPLQPHVARWLPRSTPPGELKILDCAAGPASTLGKTLGGQRFQLVAVDALADAYREMLTALGLDPPVRSRSCEVEQLNTHFSTELFDLVYMRFALDHCYDPIGALLQMVRVTRPGGVVMVEHYRDTGEVVYQGLRQWSLHPEPAELVIANPGSRFAVSEQLPGVDLEMEYDAQLLTMVLHKRWPA